MYSINCSRKISLSAEPHIAYSAGCSSADGCALFPIHRNRNSHIHFKKYDTDQKRSISEQVNGLWFLTGDLVGFRNPLSSVTPESLMPQLNALVKNLNLDFNLYDEKGYLYYSSQPKIFEQNIVSGRMNPEAYFEMQQEGKTQYIHPENAGKLNYISLCSIYW